MMADSYNSLWWQRTQFTLDRSTPVDSWSWLTFDPDLHLTPVYTWPRLTFDHGWYLTPVDIWPRLTLDPTDLQPWPWQRLSQSGNTRPQFCAPLCPLPWQRPCLPYPGDTQTSQPPAADSRPHVDIVTTAKRQPRGVNHLVETPTADVLIRQRVLLCPATTCLDGTTDVHPSRRLPTRVYIAAVGLTHVLAVPPGSWLTAAHFWAHPLHPGALRYLRAPSMDACRTKTYARTTHARQINHVRF